MVLNNGIFIKMSFVSDHSSTVNNLSLCRVSSLVYYLMAASTGVEVANFNLAFLLDENEVSSSYHNFSRS